MDNLDKLQQLLTSFEIRNERLHEEIRNNEDVIKEITKEINKLKEVKE